MLHPWLIQVPLDHTLFISCDAHDFHYSQNKSISDYLFDDRAILHDFFPQETSRRAAYEGGGGTKMSRRRGASSDC